ncbi:MAG: hypothetical protein ACREIQ_01930 [Nitrospiria bacterium]
MMLKHVGLTRLVGKAFLVSGFFLAIYGLTQSSRFLVNVSLGLLASGIAAMAASFYHSLKSRGPDKGPSEWMGPHQK